MDHPEYGSDADDGSYESSYHYFLQALTALTHDPVEQCRMKQYDNVAWFLKDDLLLQAGLLLNSPSLVLSNEQLRELAIVLSLVGSIPCQITNVQRETRMEHEASMRDPCWDPIRKRSQILVDLLKDETLRVQTILAGEHEQD